MPIKWVPLVWPGVTGSGMTVKLKNRGHNGNYEDNL